MVEYKLKNQNNEISIQLSLSPSASPVFLKLLNIRINICFTCKVKLNSIYRSTEKFLKFIKQISREMARKSQDLVRKKNFSSSSVPESSLDNSMTTKQFDGNDDDHLPLSKWIKNQNVSNASQTGQEENQSTTQSDENHQIRKLNTKLSYEMMPGFRFNSNLLFCPEEQQFYVANSSSEIGLGYTCYMNECRCRVHIRNDECYIGNTMAHNHERKMGMYYNLRALNEIKHILNSVDNQLSPKQVFDDVTKR